MRQAGAHLDARVQVVLVIAATGAERDHEVGVAALRADVVLGVDLAPVELLQGRVGRVAAPRAVALHFPAAAEILGGIEVDAHVVACRASAGV